MITTEKVKQQMAELEKDSEKLNTTKMPEHKRKRKHRINVGKYERLRMISLLLEHNPTEAFLELQLEEIKRIIKVLMERFPEFRKDNPIDKDHSLVWYKDHSGITDMRKQKKNIEYILETK